MPDQKQTLGRTQLFGCYGYSGGDAAHRGHPVPPAPADADEIHKGRTMTKTLVLIRLTHAHEADGKFVEYGGPTFLDPSRIESIEDIHHPDNGRVTYITMRTGHCHVVQETPDEIFAHITAVARKEITI